MSLLTVSAASTVASPNECQNNKLYVDHGNRTYTCTDGFIAALNSIEDGEKAEIVLLQDKPFDNTPVTIDKDVTINLNSHKLTTGNVNVVVKGANVTFKNGKLDLLSTHGQIEVNSSEKASTLTIDATVNATYTAVPAITVSDATNTTIVNLKGEWTVSNEVISCSDEADKLIVNLDANITSTNLAAPKALVKLDAGNAVVNVNSGTYKSNDRVFIVKNGTLNVNGGTVKATGTSTAIWVQEPATNYTNALNVKGGLVTSESSVEEAIWFTGTKGTYSFNGGTVTSGKDAKKKQLPALHIDNEDFLDDHKGMIIKGTFTGSIVGNVKVGKDTYKAAKDAAADLVGNATVSEKDGVVTVGNICQRHLKFRSIFNL